MLNRKIAYIISAAIAVNILLGGFTPSPDVKSGYIPNYGLVGQHTQTRVKGAVSYPSYYNAVDEGLVSGVNNQKSTSLCWAFSQNEVAEASIAKKTGLTVDLSEQTMKFETSNILCPDYGYMRNPNGGGNEFMSIAYLARKGTTLESDEPFNDSNERTVDPATLTYRGMLKSAPICAYGVNYKNEYRADAVSKVKELVTEYGAVATGIKYYNSYLYKKSDFTNYFYYYPANDNDPELAENRRHPIYADHEVTIVGWDDNYPASEFVRTPECDGAFIVKNSHGLAHDNQTTDIFYISYCDELVTQQFFASDFDYGEVGYDNVYQYDLQGWCVNGEVTGDTAVCVTKFDAKSNNELLSAIGTYVADPETYVEVLVSPDGRIDSESDYISVYSGVSAEAGYFVYDFEPVRITHGSYAVAVKYSKNAQSVFYAMCSNSTGIVNNAVNIPDTCYSGASFSELRTLESQYDEGVKPMNCIKAFTINGDTPQPVDSSAMFSDIASGKWYTRYTDYAVGAKLFSGVTATTFEPETELTRAMFVRVLANLNGVPASGGDSVFTDVESGRWYTSAVSWAYGQGIVTGITDTVFQPYAIITRQQMCAMLVRCAASMGITLKADENETPFADDALIQNYAKSAVYACKSAGIINGMTETEFAPRDGATRAQGAKVFAEFADGFIYTK